MSYRIPIELFEEQRTPIELFRELCDYGFDEKKVTDDLLWEIERHPNYFFPLACTSGNEEIAIYVIDLEV